MLRGINPDERHPAPFQFFEERHKPVRMLIVDCDWLLQLARHSFLLSFRGADCPVSGLKAKRPLVLSGPGVESESESKKNCSAPAAHWYTYTYSNTWPCCW